MALSRRDRGCLGLAAVLLASAFVGPALWRRIDPTIAVYAQLGTPPGGSAGEFMSPPGHEDHVTVRGRNGELPTDPWGQAWWVGRDPGDRRILQIGSRGPDPRPGEGFTGVMIYVSSDPWVGKPADFIPAPRRYSVWYQARAALLTAAAWMGVAAIVLPAATAPRSPRIGRELQQAAVMLLPFVVAPVVAVMASDELLDLALARLPGMSVVTWLPVPWPLATGLTLLLVGYVLALAWRLRMPPGG